MFFFLNWFPKQKKLGGHIDLVTPVSAKSKFNITHGY